MGETEMGVKTHTKVVAQYIDNTEEYRAARKWCTERFGPSMVHGVKGYQSPWYAYRFWAMFHANGDYILGMKDRVAYVSAWHFRDPAHATMFQLVWAK